MAWCPFATKMELQPESDAQPPIIPTQMIMHSVAAPWTAQRIYEYWRDSTALESHLGLGYAGDLAQYIGTETRADANYKANLRPDGTGAVSIETASNTDATDPWTSEQVEQLIRVGVWLHQHHGLPLRVCRSWDDPGYGYHRLWPEWSVSGTYCPGDTRAAQFHDVVFPGIVARASDSTAAVQEDDMPKFTGLGSMTDVPLTEGQWKTVLWDVEWHDEAGVHYEPGQTFVAGPASYQGDATLRFEGLAETGAQVQARVVEDEAGQTVHHHPEADMATTLGVTLFKFPFTGLVRAGRRVKVQVRYHGAADGPVVLGDSYLQAQIWERS